MADHLLPILDECLARLEAGASVDECLRLYPEQADDLAPLLRAAARLQAVEVAPPRPAFLAQSPARLVRRIQAGETARPVTPTLPGQADGATAHPSASSNGHARPAPPLEVVPPLTNGHRPAQPRPALRQRPRTWWLSLAAALLLVALLGIGTMSAAAGSLPGDTLYPLKRAGESAWLALPRPPLQQVEARLALAQTRLDEVYRLTERGDTARAAQARADYQAALIEATQQAEATDPAQALSAAFGVDAGRLRAAHAQGVPWRELTLALSLAGRAEANPATVIERLAAGEPAETVLASLNLPSVITADLPALLGETPLSPAPPSPAPPTPLPTTTPLLPTATPALGGLVAPLPTRTEPTTTAPSVTPGRGGSSASPAPPTGAPGETPAPAGAAPTQPSEPPDPARAPVEADRPPVPTTAGEGQLPQAGPGDTLEPTVALTVAPSTPGAPTALPPIIPTTLPPILPTALPPIVPTALPTIIPTAIPALPTIIPTAIPPIVPTAIPPIVPTAIPPIVPTAIPPIVPTAIPPIVPTAIPPIVPTAIPPIVPTAIPPIVPTAIPPIVPTAIPPIVPTAIPALPTAPPIIPTALPPIIPTAIPALPTTPPIIPTAIPVLPTTPPILPTIRRP